MRRLRIPLFLLAAVVAGPAFGQSASEPGLAVSVDHLSERVFRGLERADDTAQVGVAWRGEAWRAAWKGYAPLRSDAPAEWRLEGGWGMKAGARASFETTLAWSHVTRPLGGMARDALEFGATVAWALPREAVVSVAAFHDFTHEATTGEAAVARGIPLTRLGAYLDLRAFVGWSDARDWLPRAAGGRVAGGYGYFGADAVLPYRIGEITSVTLGLSYSEAWNARDAGIFAGAGGRRNLAARIGVTFDF